MLQRHWRAKTVVIAWLVACSASPVLAHSSAGSVQVRDVPAELAVRKELGPPANGVVDLKFLDLFKMPVGPRGLEVSDALRAADGKTVRVIGFMVQQDSPRRGGFLLAPLPVAVGDEDEGLADDLPPALIFIDIAAASTNAIPSMQGLLQISGTLHVGARENPQDQRISLFQITPDARTTRGLLRVVAGNHAPRNP